MNSYALKEYQIKRKMEDFALALGYLPFEPPLFENYDSFSSISCEIKKEQLATVVNGQKFQLLRPDITTSIMNSIRPNIIDNEILKLFYQSKIYRTLDATDTAAGIKAINQFGIEYLGVVDKKCEQEVLDLAISYLKDITFLMEVGTTKFLDLLLQLCNLDHQQEKIFRKLVSIKNREELMKFGKLHHLPEQVQAILPKLFTLRGSYKEVVTKLQNFPIGSSLINALTDIAYLKDFDHQIIFDLSMTSELTYYDGIIFKGYYRNIPQAVLSGGRYAVDEIINYNAIGFSIEVDNWLTAQKEEGSAWNI